ncbi:MAG: hypothetical protein H8E40_01010 [Chloroflexi bacterium]|nr:hypothetical protein [Chloroflexota bacterium]MBL7186130.1 hypothetical protein [Phycisphaerae bacterium]
MATEEEQVGLECLDDETLSAIVDSELREHGKLTSNADIALQELKRRTPE